MSFPSLSGTSAHARRPLILLAVLSGILIASVWDPPAGRFSWWLEVGPGVVGILVLAATYRHFPMTHIVYVFVFVHTLILNYGGIYTYAETPLGNWAQESFELARNHYDRVGHIALGFFPAIIIREVLLRATPLRRGGWLVFLVNSVVLAIAAFWELLEWWVTLLVASDTGTAFLGSQGDIWDAQWDMFLALVGAVLSLAIFAKRHDLELRRLACTAPTH